MRGRTGCFVVQDSKQWVTRESILLTANELTHGPRDGVYGTPQKNHERIAAMWSVILGIEVQPYQAALCMAALKIARLVASPDHVDSYVDGAAYMAIAGELALTGEHI